MLRYKKACSIADKISDMEEYEAVDFASEFLSLKVSSINKDRIPEKGPCFILCNHPTGIADGVAIYDAVKQKRDDTSFFINSELLHIKMSKKMKTYRQKRDLDASREPEGKEAEKSSGDQNIFVIQKHDAQNLHYDFRLAIDGALVSWAIPKGLSTAANEKRLAIRTEDHPMEYADFEGVIPEDEYGGGTVMVWDEGTYAPIIEYKSHEKTMKEALEDGALKFDLQGHKITGGYAMARTRKNDDEEQWVIFKLDDDEADARRNPVSTEPESVKTGRSMSEIEKDEKENGDTFKTCAV